MSADKIYSLQVLIVPAVISDRHKESEAVFV
jgi:hypothetical protein